MWSNLLRCAIMQLHLPPHWLKFLPQEHSQKQKLTFGLGSSKCKVMLLKGYRKTWHGVNIPSLNTAIINQGKSSFERKLCTNIMKVLSNSY